MRFRELRLRNLGAKNRKRSSLGKDKASNVYFKPKRKITIGQMKKNEARKEFVALCNFISREVKNSVVFADEYEDLIIPHFDSENGEFYLSYNPNSVAVKNDDFNNDELEYLDFKDKELTDPIDNKEGDYVCEKYTREKEKQKQKQKVLDEQKRLDNIKKLYQSASNSVTANKNSLMYCNSTPFKPCNIPTMPFGLQHQTCQYLAVSNSKS